ncbi:MAG: 50S ribosomal protein L15, large subunit ribosomal protein L15 [Candidatus Peregrinibacteria bacterium GW2011_GWE2_39_6]|nr:MAG: 50S ribosomal protein L15, large subunit ribosomal protein L15 [Candidatus Peregrinibacteria bacterium GW2011_GWF2_39_17]KKR26551.1 MAG: 50S ribosomal protein L15, large subunit ribosomal protein L15 [Candidatus Peregrinibacteria bacterium GW2011_GWE2_39_6]
MQIHTITRSKGLSKPKKRLGRGNGSGKGTYAGRGRKGQSARTGGKRRPGFSGGQTTLMMRMPKLGGFKNHNRVEYTVVNVDTLEKKFTANETVDKNSLLAKGLINSTKYPIKILGNGNLSIALTVKVDKISKIAGEKITQAKGKIE